MRDPDEFFTDTEDDDETSDDPLAGFSRWERAEIIEEAASTAKREARLKAKRKAFFDELWAALGPGTRLTYGEDPAFVRKFITQVRNANYRDGCLVAKEYGYILWAARVVRVRRSRDILGGLCRMDPNAEVFFGRSALPDDFMFSQILLFLPVDFHARARYVRWLS